MEMGESSSDSSEKTRSKKLPEMHSPAPSPAARKMVRASVFRLPFYLPALSQSLRTMLEILSFPKP
jgi:hypothetical protein